MRIKNWMKAISIKLYLDHSMITRCENGGKYSE